MRKLWPTLGRIVFWCSWPALWLYLRSSKRTRVLIVCGDDFLVLRSWLGSGEWSLSGGGLHKGEPVIDGLVREVKEETGLKLDTDNLTHAYQAEHRSTGFTFTYDCFTYEFEEKPMIKPQKGEIYEYAWQSFKNITLPLSADTKKAIAWWHDKK